MSHPADIEIIPYSKLGGLHSNALGLGIFLKMGAARLNVGAILQTGANQYLLNIKVMDDFPGLEYDSCEMSEQFVSIDAAAEAAYLFLGPKKRPSTRDKEGAAKMAKNFLEIEHPTRPPMAILAMDTHRRLFESEGNYPLARALQEQMDEICRQWGTTPEQVLAKL